MQAKGDDVLHPHQAVSSLVNGCNHCRSREKRSTACYVGVSRLADLNCRLAAKRRLISVEVLMSRIRKFPSGLLRPEIADHLKHLDLTGCHISLLPPCIASFTCLQSLCLRFNLLNYVSPSLLDLASLVSLSLASNCIEVLPSEISRLTRLECLDLSDNALRVLPLSLSCIASLAVLDVAYNDIGHVSSSLVSLRQLNLRNNRRLSVVPLNLATKTGLLVADATLSRRSISWNAWTHHYWPDDERLPALLLSHMSATDGLSLLPLHLLLDVASHIYEPLLLL
jgi:Leucine-rich repeat (LRR) protein